MRGLSTSLIKHFAILLLPIEIADELKYIILTDAFLVVIYGGNIA